ncbi:MAG: hypothetical protein KAG66_12035, partial [Methylococcales bacterium]|nr:hypothetical protein [Methylococcales bacterium]
MSGDICTMNACNTIHVAADEGRGEFNDGDEVTPRERMGEITRPPCPLTSAHPPLITPPRAVPLRVRQVEADRECMIPFVARPLNSIGRRDNTGRSWHNCT